MTSKFYLRVLQFGAIASLVTVFLVFSDLLFPYITSKQLTFNILTEFLLLIWAVFIWKFPTYRPKKSLITWGIIAFLGAILLSCFVSVDFNTSFWGDAERMLGVFHIIHFFFLYLVLITVFKSYKDWQVLLASSVAIATIVSIMGLAGNAYSTIGNTAYVSGYLIFNLYFCALLFFRAKKQSWRWFLLIPVLIMLFEFAKTHTSGAIIGLGISVLFIVFLIGVLHQNKKIKIAAWSSLIMAILILVLIFSQQNAAWFENSFLKNLTAQKATFQTRLISWEAAAKDFHNHPLLGVGFGNYSVIFDRYFQAKFYDYSRGDTYFDRAHNNLIDIASTSGIIGLLAYLSIFVAVIIYLLQLIKKDRHNFEPIILIGLFTAYFIQNLAVFDSLVTYIGLMISLAYIYYLINPETAKETEKPVAEFTALTIGFIIVLILTNYFNIRPWQAFQGVIKGYTALVQGEVNYGLEVYKDAFSSNTPLDRDGKTALINSVITSPQVIFQLPPAEGKAAMDYVISLARENLENNYEDSLMQLQLAQVNSLAFGLKINNPQALNTYYDDALKAVDASIGASPQRIPVYFMKANILLAKGNYDGAISVINQSIEFNPKFPDTYCQLYRIYSLKKDLKNAYAYGDKCVDLKGGDTLGMSKEFLALIDHYYQAKDWDRSIALIKQLVIYQPNNEQAWRFLAEVYQQSGDIMDANEALSHVSAKTGNPATTSSSLE
ncbi:MAG: O-antigen ligase family protein [Candidatus Falkowbacteria bacterium]